MKEKKSKSFTFRTTQNAFDILEREAESKGITVSTLVDRIIRDYTGTLKENESQAKQLLNYISETECTDFTELSMWAIQNNCTEELTKGIAVWRALLDENSKTKG